VPLGREGGARAAEAKGDGGDGVAPPSRNTVMAVMASRRRRATRLEVSRRSGTARWPNRVDPRAVWALAPLGRKVMAARRRRATRLGFFEGLGRRDGRTMLTREEELAPQGDDFGGAPPSRATG